MADGELEFDVTYRDENAKLVVSFDGDDEDLALGKIRGKDKTVLKLRLSEDGAEEEYCSDHLEYDWDKVSEAVTAAWEDDEDEDEDEEEDEDNEDEDDEAEEENDEEEDDDGDDEEDEDEVEEGDDDEEGGGEDDGEDDDEIDEDEDADYGEPVVSVGDSSRPTLHAVLVGYGADIGVPDDMRLLRSFFGELQELGIVNVEESAFFGAEATPESVVEALEGLEPDENDVVWFYYSGHGCMEENDRLLCTRGKMLRRQKVVDVLHALPARLRMVVTDCCAVEIGRVPKEEKFGASRPGDLATNLRKLFLGYGGMLNLVSSADFQFSYGGVFTPALVKEVLLTDPPASWEKAFERVKEMALDSKGAMPDDMKKKFKKAGIPFEDGQKPEAYSFPRPV